VKRQRRTVARRYIHGSPRAPPPHMGLRGRTSQGQDIVAIKQLLCRCPRCQYPLIATIILARRLTVSGACRTWPSLACDFASGQRRGGCSARRYRSCSMRPDIRRAYWRILPTAGGIATGTTHALQAASRLSCSRTRAFWSEGTGPSLMIGQAQWRAHSPLKLVDAYYRPSHPERVEWKGSLC
jgi:hypothetical protein